MWYVYRLSFKGIPIYIGLTGNPYQRYRQHYSLSLYQTSGIIHLIRTETNEFIDMDILYITSNKYNAFSREEGTIKMYSNQSIPLFNDKHNSAANILRYKWPSLPIQPPRTDYTIIYNKIKEQINEYEQKHRHNQMDYATSISN